MGTRSTFDRRTLLRQFGPATAFVLPLLRQRTAVAATGLRRFLAFHIPNGVHGPQFWPAAGTYDFTGRFIEPLTPVKAKTTLFRGVSFAALVDHEGLPKLFTNQKVIDESQGKVAGPSVDWVIADHLQKGPNKAPIHSVQIGIDCYSPASRLCAITYNNTGARQAAETNPRVIFDRLFSALDASCQSGGKPAPLSVDQQRRRSILDALRADLRDATTG